MPSNSRNENQYYGKMFESIIVSQLNQTPLEYKEDFSFDDATIKRLDREAQQVVDLLKNHTAIYTGDKTSTSSGDILLDDGKASTIVMKILVAAVVIMLIILLFVIFKEQIAQLLKHVLYSKEELELMEKWATL
ncbi:MAG: hypothetical protein II344_03850 [Bacteroidales bacterium]|nr:hypothetical protein [Bacteroidales bacterium]